jgi:hypothetical protein
MEQKTINDEIYSRKTFKDYKLRVQLEINSVDCNIYHIDIYTTQINKEDVWDDLLELMTKKVQSFTITHWSTKEQDDSSIKFFDEWLNEKKLCLMCKEKEIIKEGLCNDCWGDVNA